MPRRVQLVRAGGTRRVQLVREGGGGGGRRMGGEGPAPPGANAACRSHPRDGGRVLLPAPRRRRPQKPAHEGEGESERKRWASGGGRVRGRRHPKLPRERVDERAGRSPHLARDAVHQRLRVLGWRHAAAARGAGAAAPPPPLPTVAPTHVPTVHSLCLRGCGAKPWCPPHSPLSVWRNGKRLV